MELHPLVYSIICLFHYSFILYGVGVGLSLGRGVGIGAHWPLAGCVPVTKYSGLP